MLVNQASVGITQRDLDGTLVMANQRFCDIVGRTLGDVLGRSQQTLTHPDDRDAHAAQWRRLLETGEPYTEDKRNVRPDGSVVWVNNHVTLARDGRGHPKFAICVTQDITARREAEERLRERDRHLRFAQEVGGIGVFTLELATGVVTVTPEFCRGHRGDPPPRGSASRLDGGVPRPGPREPPGRVPDPPCPLGTGAVDCPAQRDAPG
jgi:PAS domain S-box-containing protein